MASWSETLGAAQGSGAAFVRWEYSSPNHLGPINPDIVDGGGSAYLRQLEFNDLNTFTVRLATVLSQMGAAGPDLTSAFETAGSITVAAGSESYTFNIADADNVDTAEPYIWNAASRPGMLAFITAFIALDAATQAAAIVTLNDGAGVAPSFTDNTGDAQTWTVGTAITSITVPEADGDPTPTYSVVGTLPAGIAFDTTTRVLSGTPTAAGSGTIGIRATNSEGTADWTVTYTTSAASTVPSRPAGPSLVVDSSTQITATGVAPDDGGSSITSYDWRHRVRGSGGSGWVDRTNVTNLVQVFSGLDASTEYDFRFRATNVVGDSPYSFERAGHHVGSIDSSKFHRQHRQRPDLDSRHFNHRNHCAGSQRQSDADLCGTGKSAERDSILCLLAGNQRNADSRRLRHDNNSRQQLRRNGRLDG